MQNQCTKRDKRKMRYDKRNDRRNFPEPKDD